MFTKRSITITILILLAVINFSAVATTYYVTPDGNDDANGLSWANAFATIGKGVDTALDGNDIWVADGNYILAAQINVDVAISIYGGFDGDETALDDRDWATYIATVDGNDSVRCFYVTDDATIDGFTITGGNAGSGAGISNPSSDINVANCIFVNNFAGSCNVGIENGGNCDPTITNCLFIANSCDTGAAIVNIDDSNSVITNCTFAGNYGGNYGTIYNEDSDPIITNCIFWKNFGKEIKNKLGASPVVTYCDVEDGYTGTGNDNNDPCFVNIFDFMDETTAAGTTTTIKVADANIYEVNDVIEYENDGTIRTVSGVNTTTDIVTFSSALGANSVSGAFIYNWGIGATDVDEDLRLINSSSPCVDTGDANTDSNDVGTLDLDNNGRFFDGDGNGNTVVDMGAYEFSNAIYVDVDATGNDDGSSWADAFDTLQEGLTEADDAGVNDSEIWVAEGTYKPSKKSDPNVTRSATFQLINHIELYGGFDGTETSRDSRDIVNNVTTLSGDIGTADVNTDNCYHVVTGTGIDDHNTIIDGFTITAGNSNGSPILYHWGGGICNRAGNPKVANCTLTGNFGTHGAAMMASNGNLITDCVFSDNRATGSGGALYALGATIDDCVFTNNSSGTFGGGIFNTSGSTITNCVFADNSADSGGGLYIIDITGSSSIINCTFNGNDANDGSGGGVGGGIDNTLGNTTVTNCIFWDNDAVGDGNEIDNFDAMATITVTYSDVKDGYSGTGNINVDPNYVDNTDPDGADNIWMTSDDGLAIADSNCIDAANGNVDPTDDILDNSRYDDPNWSNIGIGDPNYVDMGAYEKQS